MRTPAYKIWPHHLAETKSPPCPEYCSEALLIIAPQCCEHKLREKNLKLIYGDNDPKFVNC